MRVLLDDDGQPLNPGINRMRVDDRTVCELVGICKGMVADDVISEGEADYLCRWLEENRRYAFSWPVDTLYGRVQRMLRDGIIDASEREELFEVLNRISGGKKPEPGIASYSTTLPLTSPPPTIVFEMKQFCFTGKFLYGSRKACEQATQRLGGFTKSNVSRGIDYLVVGDIGSRDWIQSSFGRKIEAAIQFNRDEGMISIVSEERWVMALCVF